MAVLIFRTDPSSAESNFKLLLGESGKYDAVKVIKIMSSDSVKLENDEIIKLIGLKGLQAPKPKTDAERDEFGFVIKEPISSVVPIEERALEYVRELLEGKKVRLEFDVETKDAQYKTQAYIFLVENDLFVNADIIRHGFAALQISPPNVKYEQELRRAYQEARTTQAGLHGE